MADAASAGYARFAAWSYQQHLTEALRVVARELLGPVNHGSSPHTNSRIPDARELGHWLPYEPACACHRTRSGPMPVAFLGLTLGADTIVAGGNQAPPETDGWLADPLVAAGSTARGHILDPARRNDPKISPAEGHWLVDTLSRIARGSRSSWGYEFIVARSPERNRVYVTTQMPTSWGDTVVYAAEIRPTALDSILSAVLDDEGLLPAGPVAPRGLGISGAGPVPNRGFPCRGIETETRGRPRQSAPHRHRLQDRLSVPGLNNSSTTPALGRHLDTPPVAHPSRITIYRGILK